MKARSRSIHLSVHIHKDPAAMAERAAHILAAACEEAVAERGVFRIALSGINTPGGARPAELASEWKKAGIELSGTEVKSIRLGTLSLKEAWCQIKDGQLYIRQMHIAPYEQGNIFNKDPLRPRRLLMHKREIMRLFGRVKQDGYALIPLSVYFRGSLVKVEVALARGKKLYDKREDAAKKDAKRQIDRAMKGR